MDVARVGEERIRNKQTAKPGGNKETGRRADRDRNGNAKQVRKGLTDVLDRGRHLGPKAMNPGVPPLQREERKVAR